MSQNLNKLPEGYHNPNNEKAQSLTLYSRAEQIGYRLKNEIATALQSLTSDWASPAKICTLTGVTLSICRRAIDASTQQTEPTHLVLTRCPGVEGLRLLATGLKKANANQNAVVVLQAAIEQFACFLSETSMSHAALKRWLIAYQSQNETGPDSISNESAEMAVHHAWVTTIGHEAELKCTIAMFNWCDKDPSRLSLVFGVMISGYHRSHRAIPISLGFNPYNDPDNLEMNIFREGDKIGLKETMLLGTFCSSPLPVLTPRSIGGEQTVYLDFSENTPDKAIDFSLITRPHTKELDPRMQDQEKYMEFWQSNQMPCKRSIMDLWVPSDLAKDALPETDIYITETSDDPVLMRNWTLKLPSRCDPILMKPDAILDAGRAPIGAVTKTMADACGFDLSKMSGFRHDCRYPLIGTNHRLALNFETPTPSSE